MKISELSKQNVDNVNDILKVGQKYNFRVIKVSKDDHKLGLSLKLTDDEESTKEKKAKKEAAAQEKTPKRERKSSDQGASQATAKPKSLLQIELEKHAARKGSDDSTGER